MSNMGKKDLHECTISVQVRVTVKTTSRGVQARANRVLKTDLGTAVVYTTEGWRNKDYQP
jgi:hypothetical protein